MENSGISIILGTYNRKKFIQLTIDSIRDEIARSDFPCEIIVVDGGSTDGTLPWLSEQGDIITIIQHNRGTWRGKKIQRRSWGYFMNLGFKCAQYKYICMLSDDCLVVPNAIVNGYNLFEEKNKKGENIGAVAFYWRNWPDDEKFHVKCTIKDKMMVNHGLFLSEAIRSVNYIDEDSYKFYCADGDLALKLWNSGYIIIDSKNSLIEHYSHANIGVRESNTNYFKDDLKAKINKWNGVFYPLNSDLNGSEIKLDTLVDKEFAKKEFYRSGIDSNKNIIRIKTAFFNAFYYMKRIIYSKIKGIS